jgi:hypothetical protein
MRFMRTFANLVKTGTTFVSPVRAWTFQGVLASEGEGSDFSEWYCMMGEKVA